MPENDDRHLQLLTRKLAATATATGRRLASAESCTGGWIAKVLTDLPGSSTWFLGGVVAYANSAKTQLLAVPETVIRDQGAVSREVAEAMAQGALDTLGADLAVAVTGIAGPDGGSADKPVGTVWLGLAESGQPARATLERFVGDRDTVRRATVGRALGLLLAALEG